MHSKKSRIIRKIYHYKFVKDWLSFLPLLLIYLAITIFFSKNYLQGDEGRYIQFAQNLLNGFYAMPDLKPGFLWNGPGYPLLISILKFTDSPLMLYRIVNSILLFFGIIFFYKSLKFNFSKKPAIALSYFLGLTHHVFLIAITRVLTESLSFFLITFSLFHFIKYRSGGNKKNLVLFIISSSFLILTKVFFAYVFLALSILSIIHFLVFKFKNVDFIKLSFLPLVLCLPYLCYTYSITSKIFYWSDSGGSSLYCMSTPYEDEFGDWFPTHHDAFFDKTFLERKEHVPFFNSLKPFKNDGLEYDIRLKKQALINIKHNPGKFFKNWILNISRTFTNNPRTSKQGLSVSIFQPLNSVYFSFILVCFVLSCIYLSLKPTNKIPFYISVFSLVYLFGISLLSSMQRFLFPIYPLILFSIIQSFHHFIESTIKTSKESYFSKRL